MSKTVAVFIGVVLMVIVLHAFRAMHASNITGKIITLQKAVWVYAVNGKDSLKTIVSNGSFKLTVKPGSWKVLVSNSKLMPSEGQTVDVREGATMDIGTITLR
jgi:hypothetical protein